MAYGRDRDTFDIFVVPSVNLTTAWSCCLGSSTFALSNAKDYATRALPRNSVLDNQARKQGLVLATRTIDQANKGHSPLHSSSEHWQQYLHAVYSYSVQLYKIVSLQKNAQQKLHPDCIDPQLVIVSVTWACLHDVANARVVLCVRQSEGRGRGTQAAGPRGCQVYGDYYTERCRKYRDLSHKPHINSCINLSAYVIINGLLQ